ncbi:hypothetical protein FHL15_000931 [Xylaria flabelliformis]|uniref:DUF202 domain-containing protein n=1 Tax=Xylaria flabelliformis TaxID=2512241 RepID=A0A553IDL4_9PEZI|nr:hypothetical protein FHL15_000931 [Xylaria flabelliformis]
MSQERTYYEHERRLLRRGEEVGKYYGLPGTYPDKVWNRRHPNLLFDVPPIYNIPDSRTRQLEAHFDMFQPHPEDRLHLRLHRARSVALTAQELVEIRAAQRTFEGAYTRTALSQFSFALIILKVFTSEFYAIGALFAIYGATVMLCAVYRRYEGNRQFFSTTDNEGKVMSKFHHDCEVQEDFQKGAASKESSYRVVNRPRFSPYTLFGFQEESSIRGTISESRPKGIQLRIEAAWDGPSDRHFASEYRVV